MAARTPMTPREREVLGLLRSRRTNAEIAAKLFISVRTVESHVSSLIRKLEVPDRLALADVAAEHLLPTRSNLPAIPTRLYGRSEEIAVIRSQVMAERVVTLVGPAGVGKTRLALEVAQTVEGNFDDGAWFVDLASLDKGDLIESRVLEAMEAPSTSLASPRSSLDRYLTDTTTLLVLDNCEHLVDAVFRVVQRVVRYHPGVSVLATSRLGLGVDGEVVVAVAPLDVEPRSEEPMGELPDALRLFEDRARAARPGFAITAENRAAVDAVCMGLDGLPLALEIAASRIRSFSPEQLAARLVDPLTLPALRSTEERHASLGAAIEWSYDLLSEAEKTLLQRLAVPSGTFGLETAIRIAGRDPLSEERVVELLPSLVDQSLVVPVGEGLGRRYRVLDSIRRFAGDRIDDREAVMADLAEFVVSVGTDVDRAAIEGTIAATMERLSLETDVVRQALAWCIENGKAESAMRIVGAFGYVWEHRGLRAEGAIWCDRVLSSFPDAMGESRVAVLVVAALLNFPFDWDRVRTLVAEARSVAENLDDGSRKHAELAFVLAGAMGDDVFDEALWEEVVRYFEASGDRWRLAHAHMAKLIRDPGPDIGQTAERAAGAFADADDPVMAANVRYWEASAYLATPGREQKAKAAAESAIEWAERAGSESELAHGRSVLARLAFRIGDVERAATEAGVLAPMFRRVGDRRCESRMLLLIGKGEVDRSQLDAARRTFSRAYELARTSGAPTAEAEAFDALQALSAVEDSSAEGTPSW